jgi:hypothetical protein
MNLYTEKSDRDLLMILVDRSERIEHALYGNGQKGALDKLSVLQAEMLDVQARIPTKTEKNSGIASLIGIVIVSAVGFAKHLGWF